MIASRIRSRVVHVLVALPIANLVNCAVLGKDEATQEKQRCAELIGRYHAGVAGERARKRKPLAESELQALKRCTQVPSYRRDAALALERELLTIAMTTEVDGVPPRPPEPAATPEGLDRRARSEARLRAEGIPINPNLPTIETSDAVKVRSQQEVVDRAIALGIVAVKGEGLEQDAVLDAQRRFGAAGYFSPDERAFIDELNPSQSDRAQFAWRYEGLGVMLWALGFDAELSRPDQIVDAGRVVGVLLKRGPTKFRAEARLRTAKELLDEADLIYRYGWACVDARVSGKPKLGGVDCEIVVERHHALNWLIGYQDQAWDDVSTDT